MLRSTAGLFRIWIATTRRCCAIGSIRYFCSRIEEKIRRYAVVNVAEDDQVMTISVDYYGIKQTTVRRVDENVERCLYRLQSLLQDKLRKSVNSRKIKLPFSSVRSVRSYLVDCKGRQVDSNVSNIHAWLPSNRLYIGEMAYDIVVNPASVLSLSLPEVIMTECTVYPRIQLQYCNIANCNFTWYRGRLCKDNVMQWTVVGHDYTYRPESDDVGYYLKVSCTPQELNVHEIVSESKRPVINGPCPYHIQQRFRYTERNVENNDIRVVSYNILGESYTGYKEAKQKFLKCPSYALDIKYRQHLLSRELLGYRADLVCLQEVSHDTFHDCLEHVMQFEGFAGVWKCRAFDINDGLATFYNKSKFELVSCKDIDLTHSIRQDSYQKRLYDSIATSDSLLHATVSRSNVLQVNILKWKGECERLICVANTHLYFRPTAEIVRLIQVQAIINHLSEVSTGYNDLPIILCGDFNCLPSSKLHQFITGGQCSEQYTSDNNSKTLPSPITFSFENDITFDTLSGTPTFTYYTSGFHGTLDYIFGRRGCFNVKQVVPMPQDEIIISSGGLPTPAFPSDHLAIVSDINMPHK